MAGGKISLYRRVVTKKDGSKVQQKNWTAIFFVRGRRFRLATGHADYATAMRWAEEVRAKKVLQLGADPGSAPPSSLAEALERWHQSDDLRSTARWEDDYKMLERFVAWVGPRKSVREVESATILGWLDSQRAHLAASTKRRNVSKLSVFFQWVASRGLAGRDLINPTLNIRIRGGGSEQKDGLSAEQLQEVLTSSEGHPQLEAAYRLAFFAAMERAAIAAARWEDIDLSRNSILVRGGKTSHRSRDVRRWTVPLLQDLRKWVTSRPRPATGPIIQKVQRHRGEDEHYRPNALEKLRQRWNADNPEKTPLPGFHEGRHTIATLLLRAGVPLYEVSRFLRHGTTATTERYYAHVVPLDRRESFDEWRLP